MTIFVHRKNTVSAKIKQRQNTSLQGRPISEATNSWPSFCQILTDLKNVFTVRFTGMFALIWLLQIRPLLAYVATLLCEILMSQNKRLTINYKAV